VAKRTERLALLIGLLALAGLLFDALLWRRSAALAVRGLLPYLAISAALGLFVFLRQRLFRLAEQQARAQREARTESEAGALFDQSDEPLTVAHTQRQFERFAVPFAAPLLCVLQAAACWRLWTPLSAAPAPAREHLVVAAFLGAQAFLFFVLGRYAIGLAHLAPRESRLLRGPGVFAGLTAGFCFLGAAAALAARHIDPRADPLVALILSAFLGLLAAESLLSSLWHLFRPATGAYLTAYETRLGRLLTDPASWTQSAAEAVDYQFGFRVSQTWLYRFLAKALLPLIVFQLLLLYLFSCFVFLGPHESGILERFGRPVQGRTQLRSGLHIKWPWPIETVRRFPAKRIQNVYVGFEWDRNMPEVMVWTRPHFKREYSFLLASAPNETAPTDSDPATPGAVPVNLLNMNIPIEYLITNVYLYAYRYAEPATVIQQVAYRAVAHTTVSKDLFAVMGPGQLETAGVLRARIQRALDRLQIGVRIVSVGVQGVHPPPQIADAFESVVGALEEKETAILEAHTHSQQVLPAARADAQRTLTEAESYAHERKVLSQAEADRFLKRLDSFARSPTVFRMRTYLHVLQETLANVRKYVITVQAATEVIQLDFQREPGLGLFDFGAGEMIEPGGE